MSKQLTRHSAVQIWFAIVSLMVVVLFAIGVSVTMATATMLVAAALVPPAILLAMWPGVQPPTVSEVLHGTGSR